jgi:gliding motility-associated-like protein
MKINLNKVLVFLLLTFAVKHNSFAQSQLTVNSSYSACPCQVVSVTATWNNVSNITYSLYTSPAVVGGPPTITWNNSNTFTVANCSAGTATIPYTLVGAGSALSVPVTSTANFNLIVVPPAPMNLTVARNHCNGANVTITAPIGGVTYSYTGVGTGTSSSNLITVPNAQANWGPNVTVTSVIGGCTVTGSQAISVAPLLSFNISGTQNVCQPSAANGLTTCVTLTANLPAVPPAINYQWFDNYNASLQLQNPASSYQFCNPTPANSGVYTVKANHQFGFAPDDILCPYSATTQVNVVATNPVVISASPSGTVCQGANVNLVASAGGATSWSWSGPGFNASIANPSLPSVVPAMSGNYSVIASFQGAFTVCTRDASVNISVIPVSVPVISMPSSVCQSETDGFILGGTANSNPNSYSWSGPLFNGTGSTFPISVQINSVNTNNSGTQFLTVYFGVGQQCAATASAQLNVIPVNTISVIPPGQVCSPTNAYLQALANGANQYLWVGPNGYTVPTQNGNAWVYYPGQSANGIYTVTAYFGGGSNLVCTNTNTVELTVNPVLNFGLVPRQQVCFSTPIDIIGPPGATSYMWTSSTGYSATTKDVNLSSAQPNNSGTYTLTVFLGPCKSSAETEVVVLSHIDFSLTPFDRTICKGDTIYLEGGAIGGSQNYAYSWNPSLYMQSGTGPQQIAIPLGSINYNLVVHDIACPNYTINHSFDVTVKQPPEPKLVLDNYFSCEPLNLKLNSQTQAEAFVTTYDFGNGLVVQTDSVIENYPLGAGIYTLTVYSKGNNGCSGKYVYPYPLTVNPSPKSDMSWIPETPTTNDEIVFYSHSNTQITEHVWSFLSGYTPGDTTMNNAPGKADSTILENPIRKYPNFGEYPVVLVSGNEFGCVDTVLKVVKVIDEFQLFVPNSFTPNGDGINDVFMPKGTGMKVENFTMDIFNRAGINIFTTKDINVGWDGKVGGQVVKDATYIYKIKVVGMNGEGRRELTGYVTIIK